MNPAASARTNERVRAALSNLPIRQIKHLILPGQIMVLTGHGEEGPVFRPAAEGRTNQILGANVSIFQVHLSGINKKT